MNLLPVIKSPFVVGTAKGARTGIFLNAKPAHQRPARQPFPEFKAAAKQRAKAVFLAYSAAVLAGDAEHAAAARHRFLDASAALRGRRRARQ